MAQVGKREDPYLGCNFLVEIGGELVGGFSEVSGLTAETRVEEYQEGGVNDRVRKLPGPTRYPSNLTLKRGVVDDDTLWCWYRDVTRGKIERAGVTIYLCSQAGELSRWWQLRKAYPVKWQGPQLQAASAAVAVETVELAHEGFQEGW